MSHDKWAKWSNICAITMRVRQGTIPASAADPLLMRVRATTP